MKDRYGRYIYQLRGRTVFGVIDDDERELGNRVSWALAEEVSLGWHIVKIRWNDLNRPKFKEDDM